MFESLNKLDVGVSERVLLLSRDEMSMLVASYADIKRCVDGAYTELLQSSKYSLIYVSQMRKNKKTLSVRCMHVWSYISPRSISLPVLVEELLAS